MLPEYYSYEQYSIAVQENNSDLRDEINFALMDAMLSGFYDKNYSKWFSKEKGYEIPLTEKVGVGLILQVYFQ